MLQNSSGVSIGRNYERVALRIAGGIWSIAFLMVGWNSTIAAIAERETERNTPESVEKAVKLAPDNAAYHQLLGEHREGMGLDPTGEFDEAIRRSPLDSKFVIRRAFLAEVRGDNPASERFLLQAARIDQKAGPRWSLMNFYFRQGQDPEFWKWFKRTLAVSTGDLDAVFSLAWNQLQDGAVILSHIPNEPRLMQQYLSYLARHEQLDDAGVVAVRVASTRPVEQLSTLLAYCDRYAGGDSGRALPVWNALIRQGAIPYRKLDPDAGQFLTNEDFRIEAGPRGFDWTISTVDGVVSVRAGDKKGVRFEFSGDEPEEFELLSQPVPLSPGKSYAFSWRADESVEEPIRGIFWQLVQGTADKEGVTAMVRAGEEGHLEFTARVSSGTLRLMHKRPPGTRRPKGSMTIRDLVGGLAR